MPVAEAAPEYQCIRCSKVFEREDRFVVLGRVEGVGLDPEHNVPAIKCTEGFECAHLDCSDPKATGGRVALIVSGS